MEESRDSEPPLCPCGFWGSAQTLGLCSKCYHEDRNRPSETLDGADTRSSGGDQIGSSRQARSGGGRLGKMDSNSRHCPSRSSADNLGKQPAACAEEQKEAKGRPSSCAGSSANEDRTPSPVMEAGGANRPPSTCGMEEMATAMVEGGGGVLGTEEGVPSTSQTVSERCKGEAASQQQQQQQLKPSQLSAAGATGGGGGGGGAEPSGGGGGSAGSGNERLTDTEPRVPSPHPSSAEKTPAGKEASSEPASQDSGSASKGTKRSHDEVDKEEAGVSPVKQKNKKRCFKCSTKLELAQREIGRCRCGRVFCSTHRHPEAHSCDFDHKEDGRREARGKMVKPTRHLGTSFRREHS